MKAPVQPSHSYLGRKKCGCAVAIASDFGEAHTARMVAGFIRDGLTVERVLCSAAAELLKRCTHTSAAPVQGSLL